MHNATYGDLEQALLTLGFTAKSGVNEFGFPFKLYENLEFDAWIILRGAPLEEPLQHIDLRFAERTVIGRGVADSKRFHRLLEKRDERVMAHSA